MSAVVDGSSMEVFFFDQNDYNATSLIKNLFSVSENEVHLPKVREV